MAKKRLNIGLVGYQFMGKAHSNAYRQVNRFFDLPIEVGMHTICGRNQANVQAAADKFGWSGVETDWRKLVENPEIDGIDVATPGNTHAEIAIAAAEAGKIVFCEKPIGNTLDEARRMLDAVQKAGVPHAVFHNYRKAPAVGLAKQLIDQGKLGEIFHIRAVYLQDWIVDPEFPLVWRLQKDVAGSGSLGDIGAHIIDMARHLLGEFAEVNGLLHTFIKERPLVGSTEGGLAAEAGTERGEVTVDDAALFLARFKNGALGTFEASRFATGRKNYHCWEINGSKGAVRFDLQRMNELEYYNNGDPAGVHGFRTIHATESVHPWAAAYWPTAHIIGYEQTFINWLADALVALDKGELPSPNFFDGYENQRVLDAVERSAENRSWFSL